ncbi:MAG TPA: tetratricopeptide repeat protein, partial [Anaerolineales bacterium]
QLRHYYETEGRHDPAVIEFPKGSYVPVIRIREGRRDDQSRADLADSVKTIAVLPFVDMSPQQDQEYFCDGISEELTNALTHVEGLRVVARTSAFAFKGKNQDAREIGSILGVSSLLEGSVRKAANRVRITAQLVSVSDGYHIWSDTFDREIRDVFSVQDEISRAIVKALKVRLGGPQSWPLVRPHTENLKAYNLYLQGRYYWNQQTESAMRKACRFFEQAVAADPEYALAYVGVSDAYRLLGWWGAAEPHKVMPRVKEALAKALELDNGIAEAHYSLGVAKAWYERDWQGAERHLMRALELKPYCPAAHHAYAAVYLLPMNRLEEAVGIMERAHELDPLSLFISASLGWVYHLTGRYDDAIAQYQEMIEINPDYFLVHLYLGYAYEHKGALDQALTAFRKALEVSGRSPLALGSLGHCLALAGDKKAARAVVTELQKLARRRYVPAIDVAMIPMAQDEPALAMKHLERADQERCGRLIWAGADPRFHRLRSQPEFRALIQR